MRMEYFKKLQCYKPKKAIIDSPISIEEIALLQNSVDKDILGRIKFINRSQQSIIAIFVHLSASNIAGEPVPIEKERYIYQDMKIDSGELYGNKIPLHLPDDTRLLTVKLEKVVFANGEIWDAATGIECEYIPQEEIDIPAYVIEKVQEELSPHFSHMEYIHYSYEEDQNFWECTCGKINGMLNKKCSFCQNDRQAQKEYLVQDKLIPLIAQKKQEVEEEIRQEEEKKRLKKEAEKREYERIQKEWVKREAEEQKLAEQAKKRKKRYVFIGLLIILIICVSLGGNYLYKHYMKQKIYTKAENYYQSGEYEKAIDNWKKIENFKDSKEKISYAIYQKAEGLYNEKKYQEAIEEWEKIENFKDSKEKIDETNKEWIFKPVDIYLENKEFYKARSTLVDMFDINSDKEAMKKLEEINHAAYNYNVENIEQYFKNTKSKDTIMISKIVACRNRDIEYFQKHSGINLKEWECVENEKDKDLMLSYHLKDTLWNNEGEYILTFRQNSNKEIKFFYLEFIPDEKKEKSKWVHITQDMLTENYKSISNDLDKICYWNYEFLIVQISDKAYTDNRPYIIFE